LKKLLGLSIEASEVVVEPRTEILVVFAKFVFDQITDRVEDHGDVEASHAGLEADFITGLFQDDLLTLEFIVSVVEFGDLPDDPEGLSIQLLLQVSIKHVIKLDSVADSSEGENVAESGAVVLHTLLRLVLESL
jgi:hypothetical protein